MTSGTPGTQVRRRGGRLAVDFRSAVLESAPLSRTIQARTAGSRLIVTGALSSGSLGWVLSARAVCYRRTITLEISAIRGPRRPVAGVEDLEYEAILEGAGPGRYLLKVNHIWLLDRDTSEMLVMPAFEGPVTFSSLPD